MDDAQRVFSTEDGRVVLPKSSTKPTRAAVAPSVPRDGVVRVSRTSSGRGGKTVTLVTGIPAEHVDVVAKELKRVCGSGGTAKDGVVEIQGDHRERIATHLEDRYTVKLAGG